ncbi:MAG TPA: DNA polymerase III subunit gamma/tau [Bacteroidales bacterium]|nr:DNA polymerase III subunit gamma/tau [Bacteroidales bacterium]HPB24396.1 DNA polymerase III subunit gamma/tau [Bacteroidales bacterium]HPI29304.1 DNA polymerase III subunit gamma/tau [Bacteroidales bacterium]HQN14999.1 DNA polymerase III subunit gamma/tau [Bacteroidales bacterium]HQP15467.1 DNA polymerase III subunit gamma/tau [Bacteroidales bacterium]
MENFIVSARKYRPATFDTVVGQHSITSTLKNAIKSQQLAQAFLFCGPRGVGKTTCARILAKTINCLNLNENFEACNQCVSCKSFNELTSFNIHELDAASNNSVDDIRTLVEQVRIPPQAGKYKVYIIDEVHMLSAAAFNAFLKTLEEPPAYAKFILATTEKHKILPTILSRCQIFDFKRITVNDMANYLAYVANCENIEAEPDALHLIAQKADGAMRDALSIFDQIAISSDNKITFRAVLENLNILDYEYYFKMTVLILENKTFEALNLIDTVLENGFEGQVFLSGFAAHLRDLLVCKDDVTIKLLEASENIKNKYLMLARQCPEAFLTRNLEIANRFDFEYKNSNHKRLHLEMAFIKMCSNAQHVAVTDTSQNTEIKKKTEPVSTEVPKIPEAPQKTQATQAIPSQPTVKKAVASAKSVISIKDETDDKKTEVNDVIINYGNEPYDLEKIHQLWPEFISKFDKHPSFYTALKGDLPTQDHDGNIKFVFENNLTLNEFVSKKPEILEFFRSALHNSSFEMYGEVAVKEDLQRKPYTPDEKYNEMNRKNPELKNFKEQLDLDIDY